MRTLQLARLDPRAVERRAMLARMLARLSPWSMRAAGVQLLVGQMHEFLGDLLFEVEFRVKLLQRPRPISGSPVSFFVILAAWAVQDLRILLANRVRRSFSTCLQRLRQHLHVALAALDLLVEDHAVEALPAFGELLREIEVRPGDETEAVDEPLHH